MPLKKLISEPLLHFCVLGSLLFFITPSGDDDAQPIIEVTKIDQEALHDTFKKQNGSAPSAKQSEELVTQFVRDEVLMRHALELGLGEGDEQIRERLVTRALELEAASIAPATVSEAEIDAFLQTHPQSHILPQRYHLQQLLARGDTAQEQAEEWVDALNAHEGTVTEFARQSAPFPLGIDLHERPVQELVRVFGPTFMGTASQHRERPTWFTARSSHGVHAVRVVRFIPRAPAGAELQREKAREQLQNEKQRAALQRRVDELTAQYQVRREG